MSTETEQAQARVASIMDAQGIEMECTRIDRRSDRTLTDWDKDAGHFRATLTKKDTGVYPTPPQTLTIEYSMGSGHRVWKRKPPHRDLVGIVSDPSKVRVGDRVPTMIHRTLHTDSVLERFAHYPEPDPADILHCIIMDASACDMSHSDWCNEYGYDPDSIAARDTWIQCVEQGHAARSLFGPAWSDLQEALEQC